MVGIIISLGIGVLVGLVNGLLTVRTSVPSLIITLGTLVAMQGIVLSASVTAHPQRRRPAHGAEWSKTSSASFWAAATR